MGAEQNRERAERPEDLGRLFQERVNRADLDGLVALYEPEALLDFPPGSVAEGIAAIRQVFEQALAGRPRIELAPVRTLRAGELALSTSSWTMTVAGPEGTTTMTGVSAEVARQQPDGAWRYVIDEPGVTGG